MAIYWFIILLIALATHNGFPAWAWWLLVPFAMQDLYDVAHKRTKHQ